MSIIARRMQRTIHTTPSGTPPVLAHGQLVAADGSNVGRAGAAAAGVANYSASTQTVSGAQTFSTTQTIRNKVFTGPVEIRGGTVTFEFCSFTYAPPAAGSTVRLYDDGAATGDVIMNWCDVDSGLRGATGTFECTAFQAGERGSSNPATTLGSFTLYRTSMAGAGNSFGMHKFYTGTMSTLTECLILPPTTGDGSHPDGMEIYSSDNLTLTRCRIMISSDTDQSCLNITRDFGEIPTSSPIIVQDCYINGGGSPVLTRAQGGTPKNVRYAGNYFGDSSGWGRECDFNGMNVTFNGAYATANPTVIYWAPSNVWAPNGEGITSPGGSVGSNPHTPGSFVDQSNFFGGEVWIWNGSVVGPAGP